MLVRRKVQAVWRMSQSPRGARPVQEVLREMAAEERDVAALLRMDVDDQ